MLRNSTRVVALQADVSFLAQQARMAAGVFLGALVQVSVHQRRAVLLDLDPPALGRDRHLVPFTGGLAVDLGGGHDVVDRPGVLPGGELSRPALVIDQLDFHAHVGRIAGQRRARATPLLLALDILYSSAG